MSAIGITTFYYKKEDPSALSCLERLDGLYYLGGARYVIDETARTYTILPAHTRDDTTLRIILIALSCLTGVGLIVYGFILARRCYYEHQSKSFTTQQNQTAVKPSKTKAELLKAHEKTKTLHKFNLPIDTTKKNQTAIKPCKTKAELPHNLSLSYEEMSKGWEEMRQREIRGYNASDTSDEFITKQAPTDQAICFLERRTNFHQIQKEILNGCKLEDPTKRESVFAAFVEKMLKYSKEYIALCEKNEGSLSAARNDALFKKIDNQIHESMLEIQYAFKSITLSQMEILALWWRFFTDCAAFLSEKVAALDIFATAVWECHNRDPEYIEWAGGYRALQNYYLQMQRAYLSIHTGASEKDSHLYAKQQLIRLLSRLRDKGLDDFNEYMKQDKIYEHCARDTDPNHPIWQTVEIGKHLPLFANPQSAEVQAFVEKIVKMKVTT
jgi:hypothetical protein